MRRNAVFAAALKPKGVTSAELSDPSLSLLQQFLLQADPPERYVQVKHVMALESEPDDGDDDDGITVMKSQI